MAMPKFLEDAAFKCLRAGDLDGFHSRIANQAEVDFTDSDLRNTDLREADLSKVKLRGSYLRDADLRGVDLRHLDLEGCSLYHARVSGTFFPANLTAEEIRLSIEFGTRLRTRA